MVVITAALKYLEAKDFQWILLSVQIIFYRKIGNTIMEEKDLESSALIFGTSPCANQERHRLVRSCLAGKEDRNRP